jgi:hypothetical protein
MPERAGWFGSSDAGGCDKETKTAITTLLGPRLAKWLRRQGSSDVGKRSMSQGSCALKDQSAGWDASGFRGDPRCIGAGFHKPKCSREVAQGGAVYGPKDGEVAQGDTALWQ